MRKLHQHWLYMLVGVLLLSTTTFAYAWHVRYIPGKISAGGDRYILKVAKNIQGNFTQTLECTRKDALLTVNFDSNAQIYNDEIISRVVDSFKPTTFKGLNSQYIDRSVI